MKKIKINNIKIKNFDTISDCDLNVDSDMVLLIEEDKGEEIEDLLLALKFVMNVEIGDNYPQDTTTVFNKKCKESTDIEIGFEYKGHPFRYNQAYNITKGAFEISVTDAISNFAMSDSLCHLFMDYVFCYASSSLGAFSASKDLFELYEYIHTLEALLVDFTKVKELGDVQEYFAFQEHKYEQYYEKTLKKFGPQNAISLTQDTSMYLDKEGLHCVHNEEADYGAREENIFAFCSYLILNEIVKTIYLHNNDTRGKTPLFISGIMDLFLQDEVTHTLNNYLIPQDRQLFIQGSKDLKERVEKANISNYTTISNTTLRGK